MTFPCLKALRISLLLMCTPLFVYADTSTLPADSSSAAKDPAASSAAQKLYASAQSDLLQLRVLLKNGNSQASVGSGFLIGTSHFVVTNYHVVSQIALEPDIYFGEYKDTQGKKGAIELLAVDVQHDLAIVRIDREGTGFFKLPEAPAELNQGERLFSLGNPLDLGFTISEGTYNGLTHRGFSEQIMFTGPVNAGMSGGPNVTANAEVAGINVAHRRDGELVSFLVPAHYAQILFASVNEESKPPKDFKPIISQQLLTQQNIMMAKLLETPLSIKSLGPYSVPVRESEQVRCWGSSDAKADKAYSTNKIDCEMESAVFVSDDLQTSHIAIDHRFYSTTQLHPQRFASLMSKFFSNEVAGDTKNKTFTTPHCTEQFIAHKKFSARAVVCVNTFQKFDDLYNFTLILASTDAPLMNLQSRLDLSGVSFENGQKFVAEFLNSFDKGAAE